MTFLPFCLGFLAASLVVQDSRKSPEISDDQFDKLHALIKPQAKYGESQYLDGLDWMLDLGQARKKAAAEGKALLLFWANMYPLGVIEGKGFEVRAPFFSNAENLELVKKHCIPVAFQNGPVYNAGGPEAEYLGRVLTGDPWYFAMATADGELLGHVWPPCPSGANIGVPEGGTPVSEAIARWEKLPEARRRPGGVKVEASAPNTHLPPVPPGTAVVKTYARWLKRGQDGALSKGKLCRMGDVGDLARMLGGSGASDCDIHRDSLWLTEADVKSLFPDALKKGETRPLPPAIAQRILRYHLQNFYWQYPTWALKEVRRSELRMTLAKGSVIVGVKIEGKYLMSSDADPAKAKRGCEGSLLGYAEYDPARKALVRFDLVALGEQWCTDISGMRYSPGPGRVTVGWAAELAPAGSAFAQLPPANLAAEDYIQR